MRMRRIRIGYLSRHRDHPLHASCPLRDCGISESVYLTSWRRAEACASAISRSSLRAAASAAAAASARRAASTRSAVAIRVARPASRRACWRDRSSSCRGEHAQPTAPDALPHRRQWRRPRPRPAPSTPVPASAPRPDAAAAPDTLGATQKSRDTSPRANSPTSKEPLHLQVSPLPAARLILSVPREFIVSFL